MKICPSCQAIFPDGFRYCPNDSAELTMGEEYVLRPQTVVQPSVAGVASLTGQMQARAQAAVRASSPFHYPGANCDSNIELIARERTPASSMLREEVAVSEISFELPEPGCLITRLGAAIRQFISNLGRGAPPVLPASAQEENVTSDISFELPDPGRLIARLVAAIQGLIKDFGRNTTPPASAQENSAATGIGFSIPEPRNLIARLSAAIKEFVRDFGKGAAPVRLDETGFEFAAYRFLQRLAARRSGQERGTDCRGSPHRCSDSEDESRKGAERNPERQRRFHRRQQAEDRAGARWRRWGTQSDAAAEQRRPAADGADAADRPAESGAAKDQESESASPNDGLRRSQSIA